eukprot:Polyplicarium_translucidae@DN856_c0_g1_i1.p1
MSGRKRGARDRLSLGDRNGRACFSSPSVSMGRFEAHDRDRRGSVVVGCASSSKHEWGGASSQWIGRLDMKAKRSISCHVPKTVHFNIGVSPGRSEARIHVTEGRSTGEGSHSSLTAAEWSCVLSAARVPPPTSRCTLCPSSNAPCTLR